MFEKKNSLLLLVGISFVFIVTTALSLNRQGLSDGLVIRGAGSKDFPPVPIFSKQSPFPVLSAQAALAVDLGSQVSLYEKDPDKSLLPASTTKILTALVVLDYFSEEDVLTVGKVEVEGQKMGLRTGEKIRAGDLLYGLLVYSANDAAEVLAQNYPGGRTAFVAAMNVKAGSLHLEHSFFTNPTGLDNHGDRVVTSARDLVRVAQAAMLNSRFAEMVRTKEITVTSADGKIAHRLTNINELVGKVPGVLGIKTGWTESARENLLTYVERDGHPVIIALLGSQDRFGETKELINWLFANYSWQAVQVPYSP
jgi:D-alanyl-D-alanine carboxypeptidase (penicillin-binding protein 5/6)